MPNLKKARKYATFRYLFLFPRHQANSLHMHSPREHIHALYLFRFISVCLKYLQVPCKGCRFTRYINNFFGSEAYYFCYCLWIYSVSGRIDNNKVRFIIQLFNFFQYVPAIKKQLSIPLSLALSLAASTASSTISMPTTFLLPLLIICPIVPVPQ